MSDEAYDRQEALGEAREEAGDPQVWDDEYWVDEEECSPWPEGCYTAMELLDF